MYKILTLNKIAAVGTDELDGFQVSSDIQNPDGIILRSFDMHTMDLPSNLKAIGRAGAGTNNIPVDKCAEQGIVVFNAPGANANAVKEWVVAALLLASRKIVDAINWTQSLNGQTGVAKMVEDGKAKFAGPEIYGKKLGVIGLGAVGGLVANAANALGMNVLGHDPYMSVDAAWALSRNVHKAVSRDIIYEECDYITLHVSLNETSKHMLNEAAFAKMKKGVRILNASRADVVDNAALKKALADGTVACYVTDFPTDDLLGIPNIITIPHLAASTPESEDNCAVMAARELREYLLYGNITNSVNYPNCESPFSGHKRICVHHRNTPNIITQLTAAVSSRGINIDNLINKSKGDYAYTMLDLDAGDTAGLEEKLMDVAGVIRVRVI